MESHVLLTVPRGDLLLITTAAVESGLQISFCYHGDDLIDIIAEEPKKDYKPFLQRFGDILKSSRGLKR